MEKKEIIDFLIQKEKEFIEEKGIVNPDFSKMQYYCNGQDILGQINQKKILDHRIICGVYCIRNTNNDRFYIGSSVNILKRFRDHVRDLDQNKHTSIHFQRSWNLYEPKDYQFYFLEIVEFNQKDSQEYKKETILKREQIYLDKFFPFGDRGYNSQKRAKGGRGESTLSFIKEEKAKVTFDQFCDIIYLLCNTDLSLGKVAKEVGVQKQYVTNIYIKQVYPNILKDLKFQKRTRDKMDYVKENYYKQILELRNQGKSAHQIGKILNIPINPIQRMVKEELPHINTREVYQFDLHGKFIRKYQSIKEALIENKLPKHYSSGIVSVCCGKKHQCNGYLWSYTKDIDINKTQRIFGIKDTKTKPVIQYDKNNNIIAGFYDVKEASIVLNISKESIKNSCDGSTKGLIKNNYYFKYANNVPEEDLDYLLGLKINNKESV